MPFRKRAIVEIDQNAKLSEIPDVGTWKTGVLNTNPRCFDLICTGKVQINSSDYKLKLNVSAMDKVPNFFTKNSAGEIVFAEPKPMCIIRMPRGHCGTIIVRLKSVSTEQTSAKDYVCLGVREGGVITDVICGNDGYKYIDMTDDSKVELVPLISATKLPNYATAEVGTKVTFSNTNFDFGTVYRITINDKQEIEWSGALTQTSGKRLTDIDSSNTWYSESSGIGAGQVKGKGIRLLAINSNTGKLASSTDGASWEDEGYVNESTSSGWEFGVVFGNGVWCASGADGVRYSTDETKTWLWASRFPSCRRQSLAFGDGVFLMVGLEGKVYASIDANVWEVIGSVPHDNDIVDVRVLCYDDYNSRWICATWGGMTYTSQDGGGTWKPIVTTLGLDKIAGEWPSCCYVHGYFYAIYYRGKVAKSSDGKDWSHIATVGDGCYNISFYGNRLYAFPADGINYYTGTFK